jgi:glutamyl-tRNA reductase
MKLLVVGLNFRSAADALLNRASRGTTQAEVVLAELLASPEVAGAMVVSTCNRVEIYAAAQSFHGALSDIGSVLAKHCDVPLPELAPGLYAHYADDAVRHVFTVASGLDSLVQGEHQILGQLRAGYTAAVESGAATTLLHEVMSHALRLGKRVHSETGEAAGDPSMADAALRLGVSRIGPLTGASAVIVGAGQMGELTAAALRERGIARMRILSRSPARSRALAERFGAESGDLTELAAALSQADVVVCATRSPRFVLTRGLVADRSSGRRLLLVDLAMPADIDPSVAALPEVHLVNLAALADAPQLPAAVSANALATARRLVNEELAAFTATRRTASVTDTIVALRERAEQLIARETVWLAGRQPGLSEPAAADVRQAMRRLTNGLLHDPTVRVKELTATEGGSYYASALRELFALDPVNKLAAPGAVDAAIRHEYESDVADGCDRDRREISDRDIEVSR